MTARQPGPCSGGSLEYRHDEATLKGLLEEHCRRMNTGDVEHMLDLYTEDIYAEDPVGSPPMIGHDALRAHFSRAAESSTYDMPGTPVAAQDGRHAAIPVSVQMTYLPLGPTLVRHGALQTPARPRHTLLTLEVVGVIRASVDARIEALWIYWGRSDVGLIDASAGLRLRR
ncbi:nuclear transport factor 2 family protein [Streptomyces phaeochromogenes]